MKSLASKTNPIICRTASLICLVSVLALLIGCSGGGVSLSTPARFAGRYAGTFSATYDPRSPLSGTISGSFVLRVDTSGAVTFENWVFLPPDLDRIETGSVSADGSITASVGTRIFGIRSLTGGLRVNPDGSLSGSGDITVVSQSELAYGTWQATAQNANP